MIFVSYARRDNNEATLQRIERRIRLLGQPYIDDLHHHSYGTDRHEIVEEALRMADAFVAVASCHYLQTPWTRKEFTLAVRRAIPMAALLPTGAIIDLRSGHPARAPQHSIRPREFVSSAVDEPRVLRWLALPGRLVNPAVSAGSIG